MFSGKRRLLPELECDLVRSLKAAVSAAVAESFTTPVPVAVPVLVLCSGEFFITFTSAAAGIRALSTPDADDDDNTGRQWRWFPCSDDVMQAYDVSGDSMTSQREVGEDCRLI